MGIINKNTIDKIFDAARIEEVVGDFVNLKKRGTNYVGLSPFVSEKTPSFYVSPVKGIFKCFSSGKGGTVVSFMMEHEKMSYPEALRYLAKKYNIEIEESESSPEQQQQASDREQIFNVNAFAQKYFHENLLNTDEGKSIGLSYIRQRGLSGTIIEAFGLGYSLENKRALSDHGLVNGYTIEQLAKTGLVIEGDRGNYDRFHGRVMFPIHNVAGRVVGFGGRTLSADKKIAKYINSPETDIYNKSRVLYGLYQAKKSVIAEDVCYLVEGYMDVISMVQAGVENVVASSGTSLTEEQILLIKRYTPNIVILYDGDKAGIKAAFRGIDLILEKGLNVKVLLFPDGDDPDSFSKKVSPEEFIKYIKSNAKDFISFKTSILLEEAASDPIKRAGLIKDIVHTISLIPDGITRSVYLKECSVKLDVQERVLITELNILLRKRLSEDKGKLGDYQANAFRDSNAEIIPPQEDDVNLSIPLSVDESHIEREIARLLVKHGTKIISVESEDEDGHKSDIPVAIAEFIHTALDNDNVEPIHPIYKKIFHLVQHQLGVHKIPDEQFFIKHEDYDVQQFAASISTEKDPLSLNWLKKHDIVTITEEELLKEAVKGAIYTMRLNIVDKLKLALLEELKTCSDSEEATAIMGKMHIFDSLKKQIGLEQGRVVIK